MTAGGELRRLEDEWATAVRKNLEISLACERLDAEVRLLQAQVPPEELAKLQQQQEGGGGGGGGGQQQQQEGDLVNGQNGGGDPMVE
jgi:hypothetical protein